MTTDAFRSHAGATRVEINVTPLIDVMLALVVIMIVAAPIALKRMPVPLAHSSDAAPPPRTLSLSVMSTGELYLQGVAVSRAQLATTLAAEASAAEPPTLDIRSDADTPYDKFADTLAIAERSGLSGIRVEGLRGE
jgi:biopolymer transport protein ExbD